MYKLLFFHTDGKVLSIPCETLEEAREGRNYLPEDSYFGIETPDGMIIDPAADWESAIFSMQLLKQYHAMIQAPNYKAHKN